MIYTETKKLDLISSLIKETDDEILSKVEKLLKSSPKKHSAKFINFSNELTAQELEEFEKNIQEGCEQINEDDWK